MKIVKHVPPPVEVPPTTYDITGLTPDEMHLLAAIYGKLCGNASSDLKFTHRYADFIAAGFEGALSPSNPFRISIGVSGDSIRVDRKR